MSELNQWEQKAINAFFTENNPELAFNVLKAISKNMLTPSKLSDAINSIILHSPSIHSIFARKCITKEILCQYLHTNQKAILFESTKQTLIDVILKFWKEKYDDTSTPPSSLPEIVPADNVILVPAAQYEQSENNVEKFPINELATTFIEWFFGMYNKNSLKADDFLSDVTCTIELIDSNSVNHQLASNNDNTLELLVQIRNQYNFLYNPNTMCNGTQGRMNSHGLVYILNCGTLHIEDTKKCVGIYECSFGLLRDPFADNNWKMKYVKFQLKSCNASVDNQPCLNDCESLKEILALSENS